MDIAKQILRNKTAAQLNGSAALLRDIRGESAADVINAGIGLAGQRAAEHEDRRRALSGLATGILGGIGGGFAAHEFVEDTAVPVGVVGGIGIGAPIGAGLAAIGGQRRMDAAGSAAIDRMLPALDAFRQAPWVARTAPIGVAPADRKAFQLTGDLRNPTIRPLSSEEYEAAPRLKLDPYIDYIGGARDKLPT